MPRNLARCAVALASVLGGGGCLFKADYGGGGFTCTDGVCPSGFACAADQRCVRSGDGGPGGDAMTDARQEALTCADPGVFAPTGGTRTGTTVGRGSTISSMCGGTIMNGPDAVFRIVLPAGKTLIVGIDGGREAYVLSACTLTPATPACLGNMRATAGSPISLTPAAGTYFIIVDDTIPTAMSGYTLTLTVD